MRILDLNKDLKHLKDFLNVFLRDFLNVFLADFLKVFPKDFLNVFPRDFLKVFLRDFLEDFLKDFLKVFLEDFLKDIVNPFNIRFRNLLGVEKRNKVVSKQIKEEIEEILRASSDQLVNLEGIVYPSVEHEIKEEKAETDTERLGTSEMEDLEEGT